MIQTQNNCIPHEFCFTLIILVVFLKNDFTKIRGKSLCLNFNGVGKNRLLILTDVELYFS